MLGIGNPLLDLLATVDNDFLTKFNLKPNDAIVQQESSSLHRELMGTYSCTMIAGGAAQNVIRGAQFLMPEGSTCYTGCVGDDDFASMLQEAAQEDGVKTFYQISNFQTGTCAVLITGNGLFRSLVANLSAANHYKLQHLQSIWNIVEKTSFFYIGGFFLPVCPAAIMALGKHALETNKTCAINLSAPFLCEESFIPLMDACLEFCDVIFANESEISVFALSRKWETKNIEEIISKLSNLGSRPRTVVVTQGENDVIVCQNRLIQRFPVPKIEKHEMVDTNGAGDAFAGGYMSQLCQNKSLELCVEAGIWLANVVIRQSGAMYPKNIKKFKD